MTTDEHQQSLRDAVERHRGGRGTNRGKGAAVNEGGDLDTPGPDAIGVDVGALSIPDLKALAWVLARASGRRGHSVRVASTLATLAGQAARAWQARGQVVAKERTAP